MQNRIDQRSLTKDREDSRNLRMEFGAEPWTLALVPNLSLSNVKFGSTADLDVEIQGSNRSRRLFTSAHEL